MLEGRGVVVVIATVELVGGGVVMLRIEALEHSFACAQLSIALNGNKYAVLPYVSRTVISSPAGSEPYKRVAYRPPSLSANLAWAADKLSKTSPTTSQFWPVGSQRCQPTAHPCVAPAQGEGGDGEGSSPTGDT